MTLTHSCHRPKASCVRCRACDATRRVVVVDEVLVRVCGHCDGPTAVRLVSTRRRSR